MNELSIEGMAKIKAQRYYQKSHEWLTEPVSDTTINKIAKRTQDGVDTSELEEMVLKLSAQLDIAQSENFGKDVEIRLLQEKLFEKENLWKKAMEHFSQ